MPSALSHPAAPGFAFAPRPFLGAANHVGESLAVGQAGAPQEAPQEQHRLPRAQEVGWGRARQGNSLVVPAYRDPPQAASQVGSRRCRGFS